MQRLQTQVPGLSVIIPVHNGAASLKACLEHAFASLYSNFEVIVVDDFSTDSSAKIAAGFPCRVIALPEKQGPAAARNIGVRHSTGQYLYFLDADILVMPHTFGLVMQLFAARPEYDAIFGSFEKNTGPRNFVSQYKNLLHHYTHQHSHEEAFTFCSGLGAVRRDAFLEIDGFDPRRWFMEDVDLGYRLHRAGYRIWLNKDLRGIHLKQYSLASLIRSDVIGRAIPWTRIMLESRQFQNDLNTKTNNVASVPLAMLLLVALLRPGLWLPVALPLALILLLLNRGFLAFLQKERGLWFAARSAGMCWVGYLYSAAGAGAGFLSYLWARMRREPLVRMPAAAVGPQTDCSGGNSGEKSLVVAARAGSGAKK